MCGIAGLVASAALGADAARILNLMTGAISHRGPDDSGIWLDADAGIGLGHRRLSIIDLTTAGHQPMISESGRFVIVYNGEIYNHRAMRGELETSGSAPQWRGHSDTEVLLAAIEAFGLDAALRRTNGMFAFALWDRKHRTLTLARDRLGEKPLFYGKAGDTFIFGSELKAMTCHPRFRRDVDRSSLTLFLRHNYVPQPRSIWCGVSKLPPASYVVVSNGGRDVTDPVLYWDFRAIAEAGAASPLADTPRLVDDLEALLMDAISMRMEADVPLGAFLSGGIDSSTVVALMQAQSSERVKTFTIGFHEEGYNEAVHAAAVAAHLGTDHTELYVQPNDALALIPRLATVWDEPFSDSSQIPTYLVSEMTRRHVTVSLSGDAGDELFGGYNRYFLAMRIWQGMSKLPTTIRRQLARHLGAARTVAAASFFNQLLPQRYRQSALPDRLPRVAHIIEQGSPEELYRRLISHFVNPAEVVINGAEPEGLLAETNHNLTDFRQQMMYLDTLTYLPDDILAKVDRASMAVSLEARVPFLDHRVVEYAWRLPMTSKIRGTSGKHILKEVLYRHVPKELMERPKMGFGVPISSWLSGPLKDWAEALLDERRLREEGFFHPGPIRALWEEHLSGRRKWHHQLWDVLMFQAWWAEQQDQAGRNTSLCAA